MLDLKQELNSRLLDTLRCPVCGAPMGVDTNGRSLACSGAVSDRNPKGKTHLFDGGAGGYVNLAPNHSGGGDSKEAVRARSAFLWRGYYTPAAKAIAALVAELTPPDGLVLDAGCGEGYYSGTHYLTNREKLRRMQRERMYGTAITRQWMDILGVKFHYVTKDGTNTLEL